MTGGALVVAAGFSRRFGADKRLHRIGTNDRPMLIATLDVYEADGLIERAARMGEVLRDHHERMKAKHPSVGAIRNIGLFGCLELARRRDPYTPLTPFNGTSDEMRAIGKFLRENGLYTMVSNNIVMTNPPLTITETEMAEGFEILDRALEISDQAVEG